MLTHSDSGSRFAVKKLLETFCLLYGKYSGEEGGVQKKISVDIYTFSCTPLSLLGAVSVSTLCAVIERVCPYFTPPTGPIMSKPALSALHWSILVSKHSEKTSDIIVKSQVRS